MAAQLLLHLHLALLWMWMLVTQQQLLDRRYLAVRRPLRQPHQLRAMRLWPLEALLLWLHAEKWAALTAPLAAPSRVAPHSMPLRLELQR